MSAVEPRDREGEYFRGRSERQAGAGKVMALKQRHAVAKEIRALRRATSLAFRVVERWVHSQRFTDYNTDCIVLHSLELTTRGLRKTR